MTAKLFLTICIIGCLSSKIQAFGGAISMNIPEYVIYASKGTPWYEQYTKTEYIGLNIDHFSFSTKKQFKLRYLINNHQWKRGNPIFIYTGGDESIVDVSKRMGFIWEIAPEFKAMVVFAEHRYYGKSLPFGSQSFKNREYFGYLTAEQALADYVELISYIKTRIKGATSSPVIAFGGSYSGMLAAWLRLKYPNIVAGSISSSAPVLMFPGAEPLGCNGFSMLMTHTYSVVGSAHCPAKINDALKEIYNNTLTTLNTTFHLCQPLSKREPLVEWISSALIKIATTNYPYPTEFGIKLPAWPVKVFCSHLLKFTKEKLSTQFSRSLQMIYNSTGKAHCLNLTELSDTKADSIAWEHQRCMEMVMPICSSGKVDMFLHRIWNLKTYSAKCLGKFGVEPRANWMVKQFWGNHLKSASNILFSNGDLDPWAAVGVTKSPNAKVPVIVIHKAANMLDLRWSNPKDIKSVKLARLEEKKWIWKWLKK